MTRGKTSKRINFTVWGRSAAKFGLSDETAMHKLDGYTTKPQTVARRLERLTGLQVVNMREDGQDVDHDGAVLSTHYEVTLGRTVYERGLDGKRHPAGYNVEGSLWAAIPRG